MNRALLCAMFLGALSACNSPDGNRLADAPRGAFDEKPAVAITSNMKFELSKSASMKGGTSYFGALTLMNPRETAAWYILPHDGSKPFSTDGKLSAYSGDGDLIARRYERGSPTATELRIFDGYRAFKVPPRSKIVIENFEIFASKEIDRMEVMGALALSVNDTMPIETWLTFDPASETGAKVNAKEADKWVKLAANTEGPSKPSPKFIATKGSWQWVVKFEK
jgi:hypothetical protein